MSKYPTTEYASEFEASIRRAFVDGGADYVTIDGWSGEFLRCATVYGQEQGWLNDGREVGSDEAQYTGYQFRLTEAGKQHFGLTNET